MKRREILLRPGQELVVKVPSGQKGFGVQVVALPKENPWEPVSVLIREDLPEIRRLAVRGEMYGKSYRDTKIEATVRECIKSSNLPFDTARVNLRKEIKEILAEPETNLRESERNRITGFLDGMLNRAIRRPRSSSFRPKN